MRKSVSCTRPISSASIAGHPPVWSILWTIKNMVCYIGDVVEWTYILTNLCNVFLDKIKVKVKVMLVGRAGWYRLKTISQLFKWNFCDNDINFDMEVVPYQHYIFYLCFEVKQWVKKAKPNPDHHQILNRAS